MSDGNTAIQVSPVTEDTMTNVRQVFQHALDAIVSASTLKGEVDELRKSVQDLQQQVDHYRHTIANYDDQVTRLRDERDAANARVYEAEDRLSTLTKTHNATLVELETLRSRNESQGRTLHEVMKERDEAQFKVLELQDNLKSVTEKLAKIEDFAKQLFPQSPPTPHVEPVATPPQAPAPAPVAEGPWWEQKVG